MKVINVLIIGLIGVGMAMALTPSAEQYYGQHETGWWQGFKNALSDMNPFGGRLGSDWQDTQHRVEDIYRDSHYEAQRRVADLHEGNFKDRADLQKKIADIYATAAAEAEKRIEKLKHPLIAGLWYGGREREDSDEWFPSHGGVRHYYDKAYDKAKEGYDKAKDTVGEGYDKLKKQLSPGEDVSMFDEASKKIKDTYHSAIEKAKEAASQAPSGKETWEDTKRRAQKAYDDVFHASHYETRGIVGKLRSTFGRGAQKAGDFASSAAWKTWHLLLHGLLAGFWLTMGAVAYNGIQWWWNKREFQKQLDYNFQGPVVLSKIYTVYGSEETQRKFQDYWTSAASNFFAKQNGLRKHSLIRGIGVGSNCWCHMSEWNSIDDLRRCMSQPELNEVKKRMPKAVVMSKRCISSIVSTGKGGNVAQQSEGEQSDTLRRRQQAGGPGQ